MAYAPPVTFYILHTPGRRPLERPLAVDGVCAKCAACAHRLCVQRAQECGAMLRKAVLREMLQSSKCSMWHAVLFWVRQASSAWQSALHGRQRSGAAGRSSHRGRRCVARALGGVEQGSEGKTHRSLLAGFFFLG